MSKKRIMAWVILALAAIVVAVSLVDMVARDGWLMTIGFLILTSIVCIILTWAERQITKK